jgi:hypothetical protein
VFFTVTVYLRAHGLPLATIIPPLLRIHSLASDATSAGSNVKCKYQIDCGTHPAALGMGAGILFSLVRRSERESNHSRPSSVEVRGEWSYTSAAPYALLACARIVLCFTACSYGVLWCAGCGSSKSTAICGYCYCRYRALCVDICAPLWSA